MVEGEGPNSLQTASVELKQEAKVDWLIRLRIYLGPSKRRL